MTDTDSLQRVIDDVFDEYAEIMNSFLFPFEYCKDCGCHFTQPHETVCIGASILASIPRRCANLKHRLAALSAQTEARDGERLAKYDELIFAVSQKWPNETRHETALRYIREREKGSSETSQPVQQIAQGDL